MNNLFFFFNTALHIQLRPIGTKGIKCTLCWYISKTASATDTFREIIYFLAYNCSFSVLSYMTWIPFSSCYALRFLFIILS